MTDKLISTEYRDWLGELKTQIKRAQIKASISVNSQLIMLYWDLGRQITEKQEKAKWGSRFIEQLSKDLKAEFPEMSGFSKSNLFYMRKFYLFYAPFVIDNEIFHQAGGNIESKGNQTTSKALQQIDNKDSIIFHQAGGKFDISNILLIPWKHHVSIVESVKDINQAIFYINKTIENNWSRAVLEYQIETNLYKRLGNATTNFKLTLPEYESDLANEIVKSEYNFEFLRMSNKVKETDLEQALIQHMAQFLMELGKGFAYLGRQYPLKVGSKEYRLDLLFYHIKLKCYIVIELKMKDFDAEHSGKLAFYVTAIDELIKDKSDNPTLGIMLCKDKDDVVVDFALKSVNSPIGISKFRYTELADDIKALLPSIEELQDELNSFEKHLKPHNI